MSVDNPFAGDAVDNDKTIDEQDNIEMKDLNPQDQEGLERARTKEHKETAEPEDKQPTLDEKGRLAKVQLLKDHIKTAEEKLRLITEEIRIIEEKCGVKGMREELQEFEKGPVKECQDEVMRISDKLRDIEWFTLNPINHIRRFMVGRQYEKALDKRTETLKSFDEQKKKVDLVADKATGPQRTELAISQAELVAYERELDKINGILYRMSHGIEIPVEVRRQTESLTTQAKNKAIEYVDRGDLLQAIDVMVIEVTNNPDMPDGRRSLIGNMGMALKADQNLTEEKVRSFIDGFRE